MGRRSRRDASRLPPSCRDCRERAASRSRRAAGRLALIGEPGAERVHRACGNMETELGAAPEHVLGACRPFLVFEIADFGLVEIAAEMAAEIADRPRLADDPADSRAIGAAEAPD